MPETKAKKSPNQKLKEQKKKERRRHAGTTAALYGGSFALPALAAWLLTRRINTAGFSPRQKQMARLAREGKLGIAATLSEDATTLSKGKNWLQYGGMPLADLYKPIPAGVKAVYHPEISRVPFVPSWIRKGIVPLEKPTRILKSVGPDNKVTEAKFFRKHTPSSIPKTITFEGVRLHGTLPERGKQLQKILTSRLGKKWVLKHSNDFQTAGTLVTDETDFNRLIRKYQRLKANDPVPGIGQSSKQLRELEMLDSQGYVNAMWANPDYQRFDRIRNILRDPKTGLGQFREDLVYAPAATKRTWMKRQFNKILPERMKLDDSSWVRGNPNEYRVHVVGGHVTGATSPRHAIGGWKDYFDLASPIQRPDYKRMHEFVRKTIKKLPRNAREQSYSLDVAPLANGKFTIMEFNPLGLSGVLHPDPGEFNLGKAWLMHRVKGAIQGQATPLVAGVASGAAGLAGVAGVGSYDAIRAIARHHREKQTN